MAEANTNSHLEQEGMGRLMCKYAIPCVISLLVATLYNIVDQIFIANAGYLGSVGNAATTVVFPLTVLALGIAMLLGDGCCTFASISLGAKDNDSAKRAIGSTILSLIFLGILLAVIFLVFREPILVLFGATVNEETFEMSKEYFFWISLGIPFYMFSQAMNPIVRSDGGPRFAMAVLLAGGITNMVLDPIFIYVFRWGMAGAAAATILGQILSALLFVWYLFHMKSVKLDRDSFQFRFRLIRKLAPMGTASLLVQVSVVLSMAAVLNMVAKYGALDPIFGQVQYAHIPTAVVGIVMKFYEVVISIAVGLATGCISLAAYNMGAKRYGRVLRLMKLLLLAEAAVGLAACVVFLLFPHQFINMFGAANESPYYTGFAVKCIRCILGVAILSCINKAVVIFQQSLGHSAAAASLSVLRDIVFGTGLPILLPIFFGLDGVLYFMIVADIVTALAALVITARTARTLRQAQADVNRENI